MSTLAQVNELVRSLHLILKENPSIAKGDFERRYQQLFQSFEIDINRHYRGKIKADLLAEGKFYSEDVLNRFATIIARLQASS